MTTIPTITQLYNSYVSALETEYGTTIPVFGPVFIRVLAAVNAGKMKLFYYALGLLQKNIFVDTADPASMGGTLERFGIVKLGRLPFAATQAQYEIEVTGSIGAVIPAQTQFKSDDDSLNPGKLYIVDTAFTLATTTDTLTVRALDAGLDSKLEVGDTLTATAPIIQVSQSAEVVSETVAPSAAETTEEYRRKVVIAFRLEAQGGAAADYRQWGLDAQDTRQIYPYAASGQPNEVNVYVEATTSVDPQGVPTTPILDDVEACIELDPDTTLPLSERGRRPLGVFAVNVLPITPLDVDITFTGSGSITAAQKILIEDALEERLSAIRPFIAGADVLADRDDIISINIIINEALSTVPGAIFTGVTLEVNTVSVSTYTFTSGDIPFLNSVTFS